MFTNKVQKLLNYTDLMNIIQTALIPIEVRTLLEVDYAIGYETYKQLFVSYQFNAFVECSLSGTVFVPYWDWPV